MRHLILNFSKTGLVAAIVALALGACWGVSRLLSNPAGDDYPDSPFPPVEANIPRLVVDSERPKDEKAVAAYNEKWREVYKYFRDNGAFCRATEEERAAVDAVWSGKYIRGRKLAEEVLKSHPNSVPALFAAARGLYAGDSNYPLALNVIRDARHLLQQQGRTNPGDADAREWYIRCLLTEADILYALGRNAAGVRVVELLEQLYGPLPQDKFWHLVKLKRYDDAQQVLTAMEANGRWPSVVLDDKLILASARRERHAALEAGREVIAKADGESAVTWSNFAEVALGDFNFEETENALRKSVECKKLNFAGTAYVELVELKLQQGQFAQIPAEVRLLNGHRARLKGAARLHMKSHVDRTLSLFLLSTGHAHEATRFARRCYEFPSRQGSNSADPISADLANGLAFWTVLQAQLQQHHETDFIVGSSLVSRTETLAKIRSESWRVKNAVEKILSDRTRVNPLRPYVLEEIKLESWMLGQFAQMLPKGVFCEMLRHARETETHPSAVPYFDALEAEASLLAGDPKAALEWAMKALAALPKEREKLLRARTNAVAAEASRLLGDHADYIGRMDQVLDDFPAVLGLLNIKIPVRIEDDAEPLAHRVVGHLQQSPQFRADEAGFTLRVARKGKLVELAMARSNGTNRLTVVAEPEVKKETGNDANTEETKPENNETALELASIAQFRARLLCPWMDLKPQQINALDIIRHTN